MDSDSANPEFFLMHFEGNFYKQQFCSSYIELLYLDPLCVWQPGYLRFKVLPETGQSWNYADKRYESGVSVFDALISPEGLVVPVLPNLRGAALDLYYFLVDFDDKYPAFLVTGNRLADVGGDGEPLLSDVQVLEKLERAQFEDILVLVKAGNP